jgi:hypothetical protein
MKRAESPIRDKVLRSLAVSDENRREDRCDRVEWLGANRKHFTGFAARIEIPALLTEAVTSYVDGHDIAATLCATAFVEQALIDTLAARVGTGPAITAAEAALLAGRHGLLSAALVRRVRALQKRRNGYAHLKSPKHRYAFALRYVIAQVHPDRIRQSDARKAILVMDEVLHAL